MKVLLVDDDANIRTVALIGLEDTPEWDIREAGSGQEALDLAAQEKPDLILLDMMMPGMDGVSTFERFRQNPATRDIPIIFMTAKVQKNEVEGYRNLGAKGVIIKPFDPLALADEIMGILGT